MKLPWRLIISITLCFGVLATLLLYRPQGHRDEHVHYHAGFKVYIDDQIQDYSGYQYMNYTPCSLHDEKKSPAEEQIEKAHLHENVGDVVHVHRGGAVWGDLFENINANLPKDKAVKAFVDGAPVEDVMKTPIDPYTTAIILIGESEASRSAEQVAREHIEDVEKQSELCGT